MFVIPHVQVFLRSSSVWTTAFWWSLLVKDFCSVAHQCLLFPPEFKLYQSGAELKMILCTQQGCMAFLDKHYWNHHCGDIVLVIRLGVRVKARLGLGVGHCGFPCFILQISSVERGVQRKGTADICPSRSPISHVHPVWMSRKKKVKEKEEVEFLWTTMEPLEDSLLFYENGQG